MREFTYRRRVQFYETDAQGVVHHSNYFRYFEEARGELLRDRGLPYSRMREEGFEVVLLEAKCEWKKPLIYDEEFSVELKVSHMDRFTFSINYRLLCDGELRALGETRHCVLREGKIVSIPQSVRSAFDPDAG